jgi:hypothetical protein
MTENVCGCTKRDESGDKCELPAGWGTDNDDGPCKYHGGAGGDVGDPGGAPEGNDNAVTVGAWSESFVSDFLRDEEIARVENASEVLEQPEGAQALARQVAAICLEQFRRTGDERFIRRYEQICDKAGIFPDESIDMSADVDLSTDVDADTKEMLAELMDRDVQQ